VGCRARVWIQGERKDYYVAEVQLWKMISRVFNEREKSEIVLAIEAFEEALRELDRVRRTSVEPSARARAQLQYERIAQLLELRAWDSACSTHSYRPPRSMRSRSCDFCWGSGAVRASARAAAASIEVPIHPTRRPRRVAAAERSFVSRDRELHRGRLDAGRRGRSCFGHDDAHAGGRRLGKEASMIRRASVSSRR